MPNVHTAKCAPLPTHALRQALDALEMTHRDKSLDRFNGQELRVISLMQETCPDLGAVEIALDEVNVRHVTPYSDERYQIVTAFASRHAKNTRSCLVNLDLSESGRGVDTEWGDIQLTAGYRDGRFVCGLSLHDASPGGNDLAYRYTLFRRSLTAMELDQLIDVTLADNKMRMFAVEGLDLRFPGSEEGGLNPWGFELRGVPDFAFAIGAVRRFQEQIAKASLRIRFFMKLKRAAYDALRNDLNELASGWMVEVYARHRPGLDPFAFDNSHGAPSIQRVPILTWDEDEEQTHFACVIVHSREGSHLELTANCDGERLLQAAEGPTGVTFSLAETAPLPQGAL